MSIARRTLTICLFMAFTLMPTWIPGFVIDLGCINPGKFSIEIRCLGLRSCAIASESEEQFDKVGVFSAYTSRRQETKGNPYTTADGTNLRGVEYCVVANNHLPFNTVIDIQDIGECVVKDRMGKGSSHKFDLYFRDELLKAKKFGVKRLKYKVVRQRSFL